MTAVTPDLIASVARRQSEVYAPSSPVVHFDASAPLRLACQQDLAPFSVAYQTYGELNAAKSNVILICHALTGDQYVASTHPITGKPGWWDALVGPGKPVDTDRFYVICPNILGGCMGSTGPASTNPKTGEPYGLSFPVITIGDMVRLQKMLMDWFGIERLLAVTGGSMGGMQALEWAATFPDRVVSAIPIATTTRHSAQQIAFNEVGRQAIMADPDWNNGNYYGGKPPARGLAVARMVGHITYMSDDSMREKFGRRLRGKEAFGFDFDVDDADDMAVVWSEMVTMLGPPRCVRYRTNSPRRAALYRASDSDGVYRHLHGDDGGIEVMTGAQCKLSSFGIHCLLYTSPSPRD